MKILKSITNLLRLFWAVFRLIWNPNNVQPIFNVAAFRNHASFRLALAKIRSAPEMKTIMDERYLAPKAYCLEELDLLPHGTLGKEFVKHMRHFKLDVVFYPPIDEKVFDDLTYLRLRGRETHDIWHCILGYNPDHLGEMSVSACYLRQMNIPLSAALLGVGFLVAVIKKPYMIEHLVEAIIRGWTDGGKSKQLLAVKWEEMWDRDINEIRSDLGLNVTKETYEQLHQREVEKNVLSELKSIGFSHSQV